MISNINLMIFSLYMMCNKGSIAKRNHWLDMVIIHATEGELFYISANFEVWFMWNLLFITSDKPAKFVIFKLLGIAML